MMCSNCDIIREERAENARLQAEVKRGYKNMALAWVHAGEMQDAVVRLQALVEEQSRQVNEYQAGLRKAERERGGYKALAERRGDSLRFWLTRAGHTACLAGRICRNSQCAEARAALATPEEAREIHKS